MAVSTEASQSSRSQPLWASALLASARGEGVVPALDPHHRDAAANLRALGATPRRRPVRGSGLVW